MLDILLDIWLIWQPRHKKLEFILYLPLSYFDHLVSKAKTTRLAPSFVIDLGSGQTGSSVLLMSISKRRLVPKIYLYILYTTDI
jgi:hypothetical protein